MNNDTGQLENIPGVGPRIAEELHSIGVQCINDLRDADAEQLYDRLCDFKAAPVDRCVLYVFRCAVYFVINKEHDPELLKWWNWKDALEAD